MFQDIKHYLIMPFGLKNAPSIFQKKMDNIFSEFSEFLYVYIDDILIFSDDIKQHLGHLSKFFARIKAHGLILNRTKVKLGVSIIEFLGLEIGEGKISLQPHIVTKLLEFPDSDLETLKGLQRFLGILNYARNYIPNLSKYTGPLYNKCSKTGERRFNKYDWKAIQSIKDVVQKLPPLQIPPVNAYLVVETDGCLTGWAGILKWKPSKGDSQKKEQIARYCSGKYKTAISTIDAKIMACLYALDKFRIFLLPKAEFTLRTDCQAIVSFFQTVTASKLAKNRWVNFIEYVTATGVDVKIEHIKGSDNIGADKLSRIIANNSIYVLIDNPGFEIFSAKMTLSRRYRQSMLERLPSVISSYIEKLAEEATLGKLISLQEQLRDLTTPKPGIYVRQQYGRFSYTTQIQFDEVLEEDIPFVQDLYDHGMIRQLDCDMAAPHFMGFHLEDIVHEESYKVLTIHSDFPRLRQGNFKPITRIIAVHYDVIWPNDLVAPEWTSIYDEEAYNITLDGLPFSFLGIWTTTFNQVIDRPFLQVWTRNDLERWPSDLQDSEGISDEY